MSTDFENDPLASLKKAFPEARFASTDPAFKKRIREAIEDIENSDMSDVEKDAARKRLAEEHLAHIKSRLHAGDQ
jgi:hypothetical protein